MDCKATIVTDHIPRSCDEYVAESEHICLANLMEVDFAGVQVKKCKTPLFSK